MSHQAVEILTELQRRGVFVAVDGDTLCLKPRRALDDSLLARVREAKPSILEVLRSRPATCSPDCYEVEPGVWIHEPHTGCITTRGQNEKPWRQVYVMCSHCQGERRCNCMACWQGGPSECVTCKGTGRVLRWIQ
jgi:TubC N-terminal docking domain